jgi:RNA polymerase sigma factor (sigma-70 family)
MQVPATFSIVQASYPGDGVEKGLTSIQAMPPPDANIDERLLQQARAGDRQAHAALYRAYAPMVYTLAYRMLGAKASAEDVLQDCFVEVIRNAATFRGDGGVHAWIKRIAINKCLSHLRSPWIARRGTGNGEASRDAATGRGHASLDGTSASLAVPADNARRIDQQQQLARALSALSASARSVVWLHDVEGYTHEEIGRLMGRSTSFSKSQLSRAYRELRELLQEEDTDGEAEPCLGILNTV